MKIPSKTIIIEVLNGMVVNVYANGDQAVLVVDRDASAREKSCRDEPQWLQVDDPASMEEDLARIIEDKLDDLRAK